MKKRRPQHEKTKISTTQVVKNFRKVSSGLKNLPLKLNCQNYAICLIFETNLKLYIQCAIVKRKYLKHENRAVTEKTPNTAHIANFK